MAFCTKCGLESAEGAKFCVNCGAPISRAAKIETQNKRTVKHNGTITKCPNCGEPIKSFVRNCPACRYEFQEVKAVASAKELAMKLDEIESNRPYKKSTPTGMIKSRYEDVLEISKTDERKINMIRNYPIPTAAEDLLEFMILAVSNIQDSAFSEASSPSKAQKALAEAWYSKVEQVHEKALNSEGDKETLDKIEKLYEKCKRKIKKAKRKNILFIVLLIAWIPLMLLIVWLLIEGGSKKAERKETERLESTVVEINDALEAKEYKRALLYAESLVYNSGYDTQTDKVLKQKWEIEQELLIDEILKVAAEDGIILELPEENEESEEAQTESKIEESIPKDLNESLSENDVESEKTSLAPEEESKEKKSTGFFGGFANGIKDSLKSSKDSIDSIKDSVNEIKDAIEQ